MYHDVSKLIGVVNIQFLLLASGKDYNILMEEKDGAAASALMN
jgi:hypothetical protein